MCTLNTDYIIKRFVQQSQKGIKEAIYYLSFDGFEKVYMTSKTRKRNSIIDYFIRLCKFIEYYKSHFDHKIEYN